jgi:uncharacterized protein HemX
MQATDALIYLTITLVVLLVIIAVLAWFVAKLHQKMQLFQQQIDCNQLLVDDINNSLASQKSLTEQDQKQREQWQIEHHQVSQQLEHRIKTLQQQLKQQQQLIEHHQAQMPEDKLYSRAQKMVLLGADVEELMTECDLPKAEAEMLVAMHNRQSE